MNDRDLSEGHPATEPPPWNPDRVAAGPAALGGWLGIFTPPAALGVAAAIFEPVAPADWLSAAVCLYGVWAGVSFCLGLPAGLLGATAALAVRGRRGAGWGLRRTAFVGGYALATLGWLLGGAALLLAVYL